MGDSLLLDLLIGWLLLVAIVALIHCLCRRTTRRRIYNWETVPEPKVSPMTAEERAAEKRRAFLLRDIAETKDKEKRKVKKK
jgi:hypothetical protein